MNTKIVSFISEKGGVGKTTSCYHIAVGLKKFYNKKVLVVDTDYQRGGVTCRFIPSMLEHFKKGEVPGNTLYQVFRSLYSASGILPSLDVSKGKYDIDIIASDPRLREVTIDKLPGSNNIRENNTRIHNHLSIIKNVLDQYDGKYDYILIDTHPDISDLLKSVIYASDYCVSPVKFDQQSSVGVPSAIEAIEEVNDDCKMLSQTLNLSAYTNTEFAGAIGMMAREYDEALIYSQRVQYGTLKRTHNIFKNYVTEGDGIRIAAERALAVYDVEGNNAEKQSNQFKKIIKEFIQRCK